MGEEHFSEPMFGSRETIPFTNGRFWEIMSFAPFFIQILQNHLSKLSLEIHSPKSYNSFEF